MIGFGQINGCTDSLACNYNASVNVDDGSCYYPTIFTTSITNCDTYAWPLNGQTYTTSGIYTNINSIPPSASPTVTGIHYTDKTDKVTVSGNYAYVTTNNSNGIIFLLATGFLCFITESG